MIGYHAVPVIADAYVKGMRGFDADEALQAMVASASYGPYGGLAHYMKLGYVPIDEEGEAASKTLEYAFDDWTHRAHGAGDGQDRYRRRRSCSAPPTGAMPATRRPASCARARAPVRSATPFDPSASGYGTDYTEGNAWQYSWYVPQDVAGLAAAHGGAAALLEQARPGVRRQGRPEAASRTWRTSPV